MLIVAFVVPPQVVVLPVASSALDLVLIVLFLLLVAVFVLPQVAVFVLPSVAVFVVGGMSPCRLSFLLLLILFLQILMGRAGHVGCFLARQNNLRGRSPLGLTPSTLQPYCYILGLPC